MRSSYQISNKVKQHFTSFSEFSTNQGTCTCNVSDLAFHLSDNKHKKKTFQNINVIQTKEGKKEKKATDTTFGLNMPLKSGDKVSTTHKNRKIKE